MLTSSRRRLVAPWTTRLQTQNRQARFRAVAERWAPPAGMVCIRARACHDAWRICNSLAAHNMLCFFHADATVRCEPVLDALLVFRGLLRLCRHLVAASFRNGELPRTNAPTTWRVETDSPLECKSNALASVKRVLRLCVSAFFWSTGSGLGVVFRLAPATPRFAHFLLASPALLLSNRSRTLASACCYIWCSCVDQMVGRVASVVLSRHFLNTPRPCRRPWRG